MTYKLILLALAQLSLYPTACAQISIAEMQMPGSFGPDSAGTVGQTVTVEGIVLTACGDFEAGSHCIQFLTDEAGGEYSGVMFYHPDPEGFNVYIGDLISLSGVVSEVHTNSAGLASNMTEIAVNQDFVEIIDWGVPFPDHLVIDVWHLDPLHHDDHSAERYEATIVEIQNVLVVDIDDPPNWRQFTVADSLGNEALIRTTASDLEEFGIPPLGTHFSYIRGLVFDSYGIYYLMPRNIFDLSWTEPPEFYICNTEDLPCGMVEDLDSFNSVLFNEGLEIAIIDEVTDEFDLNWFVDDSLVFQQIVNSGDCGFHIPQIEHLLEGDLQLHFELVNDNCVFNQGGIECRWELYYSSIQTNIENQGGFNLEANYPNPFNPATTIEYVLTRPGLVELRIHNIAGQQVASLVDQVQQPGEYSVLWDGQDFRGMRVGSGVYIVSLNAGRQTDTRKLMLLR
jgi:hypothetical protein